MNQALAVIPARYASTRLPGKPLLADTGLPLVVHVAQRAAAAPRIDLVLIATDDQRIADAVAEHGFQATMTRADHPNGTSRIAEAVSGLPRGYDIVVNVQGDEPEIEPAVIDRLVERIQQGSEPMATVVAPFARGEDPTDPNVVKVALNAAGGAMYFSRSPIPHARGQAKPTYLKHLGIYAYRRDFLEQYVRMPATPAELSEQLEQLRVLEHGLGIGCIKVDTAHVGIDTPEEYRAFVQRHVEAS
jgi:3-deoxy-manno-octulosonate cytidylyltransferase (CMP-KDO synthetase)